MELNRNNISPKMRLLVVLLFVGISQQVDGFALGDRRVGTTPETAGNTTIINECTEVPFEVVFVLDSSGSVGAWNFTVMKNFVKNVIGRLNIGVNGTHAGVITYTGYPTMRIHLTENLDQASLEKAVDAIPYVTGITETHMALDMLAGEGFIGARPGIARVGIVMTDGMSLHPNATAASALNAQTQGINLFAVGIGPEINNGELSAIATDPDKEHIFKVENFAKLDNIVNMISTRTCKAKYIETSVTTPPPVTPVTPAYINTTKNATIECNETLADIVFILDTSGSVGVTHFQLVKQFVINIINDLDIGENKTKVGVITYSNYPKVRIQLGEYSSKLDLLNAVNTLGYFPGGTGTDAALDLARSEGFQGERAAAPNIAIVVTDGYSTRPQFTKVAADLLKQNGTTVFSIGVGEAIDKVELNSMASTPTSDYVYFVANFTDLSKIEKIVTNTTCGVPLNPEPVATTSAPGVVTAGPPGTEGTSGPVVTTQAPTGSTPEPCFAKIADVMFVIDSSGSVGTNNFELVKTFVKQMIDVFDVSLDLTRVGVISFNSASKIEFGLGRYNTSAENKQAIDNIVYAAGGTNTGEALENLRQNGFSNARAGVPKIAIVITDGLSNDPAVTKIQARVLKDNGVTLIAIGVGNETNSNELEAIASVDENTDKNMVYQVGSFAALQTLNSTVPTSACAAVVPTYIPPVSTSAPIQGTTAKCGDTIDNCGGYGRSVCSDYRPWAVAHCAAFCGLCEGAPPTTPTPCVNNIQNCKEYGTYICTTTSMAKWAHDNCPLYCNFCDPLNTGAVATTPEPAVATTGSSATGGTPEPAATTQAPTNTTQEPCFAKIADVMFVVDSSGSVGPTSFGLMKSFIKQMIDVFDVSVDHTRVGVITFNSGSTIQFKLGQYNTSTENKQAIDSIPFTAGGTNTGEALENLRQNGFNNARAGVANIAIVITDGLSNDPVVTKVQAKVLKDNGVTLIAIGVGNEANSDELTAIASVDQTTGKSMVYQVGSFEALQTLNSSVPTSACAVVAPTYIPPSTTATTTQGMTDQCRDTDANCDGYGNSVCSDYKPWAKAHCAAYCGFCTGAVTTAPPPCVNTIQNCQEYGAYICTTTSMVQWVKHNCRLYCNLCDPLHPGAKVTTPTPAVVTTGQVSTGGTPEPAATTQAPTNTTQEPCVAKIADVIFVVDSSGSVGQNSFELVKSFIKQMVDVFDVNIDYTRVGVITFNSGSKIAFTLGQYNTSAANKQAIDNISFTAGGTNTGGALENLRLNGFTNDRAGVPNIAIVITDGLSNDPAVTKIQAKTLKDNGVTLIAIGVGNETDSAELTAIASVDQTTGKSMVYQVGSFEALQTLNSSVPYSACSVVGPTNVPPATTQAPTKVTSNQCGDTETNCAGYGRGVCSDYKPWAKAHCAAYCGFCTGAVTKPAPPCVDKLHNCAEYGTEFCTKTTMAQWAHNNCPLYCNFCAPTVASTVSSLPVSTTGTSGTASPLPVSGEPTTPGTGSTASPAPVSGEPSTPGTGSTASPLPVSGEPTTPGAGSTASPAPVSGEPTTPVTGLTASPAPVSGEPSTPGTGSTASPAPVSGEPTTPGTGSTASPAPVSGEPSTPGTGSTASPLPVSGEPTTPGTGSTASPAPVSGEPTTPGTGSTASPAPVSGEPSTPGTGSTASPAPVSGEPTTPDTGSTASPEPVSGEPTTPGTGSTASPAPVSGEPTTPGTGSTASPLPVSGEPTTPGTGSTASPAPVSGEPTTPGTGSTASPAPVSGEPSTPGTGSTASPLPVSGEPTTPGTGSTASPAPVSGEPTTPGTGSTASPAPVSGEPSTPGTGSTASPAPVSGEPTTPGTGSTASPAPVSGEPTTPGTGSTASPAPVSGEPSTPGTGSTASPLPVSGEPTTPGTGSTASPAPVSGEPTTPGTGSTASPAPVSGEPTTPGTGSTASPASVSGEPSTPGTGSTASPLPVSGESTTPGTGSTASPAPVSGEPTTPGTGSTASPAPVSGEPTTPEAGSTASPAPVSGEPTTPGTGSTASPAPVSGEPTTPGTGSTASPAPVSGEPTTPGTGSTASPAPVSGESTTPGTGSTASPAPVSGEPTTPGTGSTASPAPVSGEPTTPGTGSTASPAPVSGEPSTPGTGSTASPAPVSGEPKTPGTGSTASPAPVSGEPTTPGTGSTASPTPVSGEPSTPGTGSTASPLPVSGEPTIPGTGSTASPAPVSGEPTTPGTGSTASPAPVSGEPSTPGTGSTVSPLPVSGEPTTPGTGSTASPAPVSGEPSTPGTGSTASPLPVSGEPTTPGTGSTASPAPVSGEPTTPGTGSTASPAPVSGEPTTPGTGSTPSPAPVSGEPTTPGTGSTASPAPVSGEPTTPGTGSTASPAPVSGEPTTPGTGSTASPSPVSGEPTTPGTGSTASPAPVSGEPTTRGTGSTASSAPVSGEPTTPGTGSTASPAPASGEPTTPGTGSTASPAPVSGEPTTPGTGSTASPAPVSGEPTTPGTGSTASPAPVSGEPTTPGTGSTASPAPVSGEPTTPGTGSTASPAPASGEPTTPGTGSTASPAPVSGEPTTPGTGSTASPAPVSGEPTTPGTGSTASPLPVSGEPTTPGTGSTASPAPVSGEPTTPGTGSTASPAPVSGEPTTPGTGSTASPAPVSGEPTTPGTGSTASPLPVSGEPTTPGTGSTASPAPVSGEPTTPGTGSTASPAPVSGEPTTPGTGSTASPAPVSGEPTTPGTGSTASPAPVSGEPTTPGTGSTASPAPGTGEPVTQGTGSTLYPAPLTNATVVTGETPSPPTSATTEVTPSPPSSTSAVVTPAPPSSSTTFETPTPQGQSKSTGATETSPIVSGAPVGTQTTAATASPQSPSGTTAGPAVTQPGQASSAATQTANATTVQVSPTAPTSETCSSKVADVVFVVDSSGSVGQNSFESVKSFMKQSINVFDIGTEYTRIGVITYNSQPKLQFALNTYNTTAAIANAIDGIKFSAGSTNTGGALDMLRNQGFLNERPRVPNIAIVITDGLSNDPSATGQQAKLAKESGTILIAIGVGNQTDQTELTSIASVDTYTGKEMVFQVSSYKDLQTVQNTVVRYACNVAAATNPPPSEATTPGLGSTTPPPAVGSCVDTIDNCESYGRSVCSDYQPWASAHCARFCSFCSDNITTTAKPCVDAIDNCHDYGTYICTSSSLASWTGKNCYKYCGLCPGGTVPTEPPTTPSTTVAPECGNLLPNCPEYGGPSVCTSDTYRSWAKKNCREYCGFCVKYVVKPGVTLSNNQTCPSWRLPSECTLVQKDADCCPLPDCPEGYQLSVKSPNED